ncbi:MAG TPA: hypothetical protein PKE27_11560 [Povalibacter sp.]|uniref:hypothetical protein n=1 Tax=Povalibacter sp. TaxID=1962978 RepID=UPI002BC1086B|nr:hypothetical protein [Povalibacter sp.]HMN45207.1 hypothetical protein [Povalibacter sp.]
MSQLITLASVFLGFIAIVIVIPSWLRHRSRTLALRTISEAIASGRLADAALIEQMLVPPRRPVGRWFALFNLVVGVGGLCVGTALSIASHLLVSTADAAGMMVGALINLSSGVGLTTLGLLSMRFLSGTTRPAPVWDYASILALVTLFLGVSGLSTATGLSLAAQFYIAPAMGERAAHGMLIGATINACTGIGFTALGLFILRTFATCKEA